LNKKIVDGEEKKVITRWLQRAKINHQMKSTPWPSDKVLALA